MKTVYRISATIFGLMLATGSCALLSGCNRLSPEERQEIRQGTRVETRTEDRMDRRRDAIRDEIRD